MARETGQTSRGIALLFALGAAALAAIPLLGGLLWGLVLRCDESCFGSGWRHDYHAPQWYLVPVFGGVPFVAALLLVIAVSRSRRRLAVVMAVVGSGWMVLLAFLMSPQWWQHIDQTGSRWLLLALAGIGAGLAAAGMTPAPRRSSG
jgi:hypothetical protein